MVAISGGQMIELLVPGTSTVALFVHAANVGEPVVFADTNNAPELLQLN